MLALILALAGSTAWAERDHRGLQGAVFPGSLDLVSEMVSDQTIDFNLDDIATSYACYDEIGVRDIALEIQLDELNLDMTDEGLKVSIEFDVRGEDMVVYGEDNSWSDACVSFERDIRFIELSDAVLDATLTASVRWGNVEFEVGDNATLTGNLSSDVQGLPDDLLLWLLEDHILNTVANAIVNSVPPLLEDFIDDSLFSREFGGFAVDAQPVHIDLDSRSLELSSSIDVEWTGRSHCDPVAGRSVSVDPAVALNLSPAGSSMLAIGVTEHLLDSLVQQAWVDGLFCISTARQRRLLADLQPIIAATGGDLDISLSLDEPPDVTMTDEGIVLSVPELRLDLTEGRGANAVHLGTLLAHVDSTLEMGVDRDLVSFDLSVHELDLTLELIDAENLQADHPEAYVQLTRVLDVWSKEWIEEIAEDLIPFETLFHAWELVIRIDDIRYQDGGAVTYVSIFHEDDPTVDTQAPETTATATAIGDGAAQLHFVGKDDRVGNLSYAWQIDEGSWSRWTLDTDTTVEGLGAGEHTLYVIARDSWSNEDMTPATVDFWVYADDAPLYEDSAGIIDEQGNARCGCATGTQGGGALAILTLVPLLALRRRRS